MTSELYKIKTFAQKFLKENFGGSLDDYTLVFAEKTGICFIVTDNEITFNDKLDDFIYEITRALGKEGYIFEKIISRLEVFV